VHCEKCTAAPQMAIESPLRGVDARLWAGPTWVSDVDDNQVGVTRVGQSLFDGVADRNVMTEPSDDLGHALGCFAEPVPRIAVVTGSADDQGFSHDRDLFL